MVVWDDRGVLKPPKPPTVHATGVLSKQISLCKNFQSKVGVGLISGVGVISVE